MNLLVDDQSVELQQEGGRGRWRYADKKGFAVCKLSKLATSQRDGMDAQNSMGSLGKS